MKEKTMTRLIKRSLLLLTLLTATLCISAVPAKRNQTRILKLADGTTVEAQLVGDERGHYWVDKRGGAYLEISGMDLFEPIDKEEADTRAQARRSKDNDRHSKRLVQHKQNRTSHYFGKKKGLIILANFSDVSFKSDDSNALFQRIANEKNFEEGRFKGSLYDYFLAQSGGQFELEFDIVGPVTVSKETKYYGQNDRWGNDLRAEELIVEAAKLADPYVNYEDYDWSGNGEVDQVYVIYAGKGEADGGGTKTIWPHEWTLTEAGTAPLELDGVIIDTYACGSELNGLGATAGIGIICHEFSHCLGFPDLYATNNQKNPGMYTWDLMDYGCYNGDGYLPAGFTSYERWEVGWAEPIELNKTTNISGMKSLQEGGEAYIIRNEGKKDEYFLLENRQKVGWDAGLPGAGLLILHVDYDAKAWGDNTVNNDSRHQRLTWVPADGKAQQSEKGAANDPFPYGDVNAFNANTNPPAKFYNENSSGYLFMDSSVEEITQHDDGTISFRFFTPICTPTFSLEGGRYEEPQTIEIRCGTEGADIYYTTDGTAPSTESTLYSEPLVIRQTSVVKAIASINGINSPVISAKYIIGEKENISLLFMPETAEIALDETLAQPQLFVEPKDEDFEVTYSSSDENVAKVNAFGKVKLIGAGSAVITASFAGNDCYNAAEASYTLTVKEPSTEDAVTLSIGPSGYASLFFSNKQFIVPEGVAVYFYTFLDEDLLETCIAEGGDELYDNMGYIVKDLNADGKSTHEYRFEVSEKTAWPAILNSTLGFDNYALSTPPSENEKIEDYKYYTLSWEEGKPESAGFYYGAEGGAPFLVKAHEAYLAIPRKEAADIKAFLFSGEVIRETDTGISVPKQTDREDNPYGTLGTSPRDIFNLQGQRVSSPGKGIYIVNGKKIVFR